jgi:hypothetical protein
MNTAHLQVVHLNLFGRPRMGLLSYYMVDRASSPPPESLPQRRLNRGIRYPVMDGLQIKAFRFGLE